MKITICGSIAFYHQMQILRRKLEKRGHQVKIPPNRVKDKTGKLIPVTDYYHLKKRTNKNNSWVWHRVQQLIRNHFNKIEWADAILAANYDKNNIRHYIGGNLFLEIGLAFYLKKKIFLLNPIPDMHYTEEILGMKPQALNGKISKIN